MSQTQRDAAEKVLQDLPADERAWLEKQMVTYADLLAFLHDH